MTGWPALISEAGRPPGGGLALGDEEHGEARPPEDFFGHAAFFRPGEAPAVARRHRDHVAADSAPLAANDGPIGALYIAYDQQRSFAEDDKERASRIAGRLSLGFQHLRQQETLQGMTIETVIALAESIESRDPYTGGHCMRLVEYAELTARELGMTGRDLEVVRYDAALHDCGKVGVPDSVLMKAGPLTPKEWASMKLHPYIGSQLCKRVSFLRDMHPIVYHHHERYDGSGYPEG